MIKFSRIFLISGVLICMNTPAYSLDLNTPGITGDLNLSSNINSNSSYQLAGVTWLPKIKDSEVGPTGNDMGYNANQGADCSGYKYSTSNCKANNQEPLGNQCLYNHKLFDNCGCNTAKFPISQDKCTYSGSVRSQAWLLGGNVCKDQRYSNRMYGKKCLCTSVNFPHTSTATCPSPQTLLDDTSKCSYQGVTRYERCKCDTAAGKYEFSSDKGEGYLCSKCTDDYGTHYKCEAVPCPTGQETGHKNNDSCNNGNGTWKETTNKSGSQQCYRCEDISNCDFYKNANGNITVPDTACSWRVYGNYTTTTLPANKSYSDSWVNMWGNSTVNGAFTTNKLAVGGACSSSGSCSKSPRTITFDDLVTVTGVIEYDPFTTMNFKKGVGGDFTCQQYPDYRYSKTGIVSNIKQGEGNCPCSVTKFIHNASTCNGILAGASCGGKYERCDKIDNCAEYDANRTQCTKCNSPYILSGGKCVTVDNCSATNGTNACTQCNSGYKVENGKCVISCNAANCKECVAGSSTTCKTCNSGYSLSNGKCINECSQICSEIYSDNGCIRSCESACRQGKNYHNITVNGLTCMMR